MKSALLVRGYQPLSVIADGFPPVGGTFDDANLIVCYHKSRWKKPDIHLEEWCMPQDAVVSGIDEKCDTVVFQKTNNYHRHFPHDDAVNINIGGCVRHLVV